MKKLIADMIFASGWLAIGVAITWSQRRKRRAMMEAESETLEVVAPTVANPVQTQLDLMALASATGQSTAPQVAVESKTAERAKVETAAR